MGPQTRVGTTRWSAVGRPETRHLKELDASTARKNLRHTIKATAFTKVDSSDAAQKIPHACVIIGFVIARRARLFVRPCIDDCGDRGIKCKWANGRWGWRSPRMKILGASPEAFRKARHGSRGRVTPVRPHRGRLQPSRSKLLRGIEPIANEAIAGGLLRRFATRRTRPIKSPARVSGAERQSARRVYFLGVTPGSVTVGAPGAAGTAAGAAAGAAAVGAGRSLLISFATSSVMSKPGST